jgi:glycerol-3-phosphate acyltransferase PlsX
VQESYQLFRESHLNFIGNVEGMDFFTDRADVIVCDGFVGNVLLKFTEGLGSVLRHYLRKNLSPLLSAEQVGQVTSELWQMTNLARRTGGPLFGVNGAVIVGHGSTRADEVAGAIATGVRYVELGLVDSMREELSEMHRRQTGKSSL